jgi:hypothetical protein
MTPQQLKAMKLALEALELLTDTEQTFGALDYGDNAITALKEALAQPADPTGQAPCARHCEATAYQITIKNLRGEIERLKAPQRAEPLIGCVNHDCAKCKEENND